MADEKDSKKTAHVVLNGTNYGSSPPTSRLSGHAFTTRELADQYIADQEVDRAMFSFHTVRELSINENGRRHLDQHPDDIYIAWRREGHDLVGETHAHEEPIAAFTSYERSKRYAETRNRTRTGQDRLEVATAALLDYVPRKLEVYEARIDDQGRVQSGRTSWWTNQKHLVVETVNETRRPGTAAWSAVAYSFDQDTAVKLIEEHAALRARHNLRPENYLVAKTRGIPLEDLVKWADERWNTLQAERERRLALKSLHEQGAEMEKQLRADSSQEGLVAKRARLIAEQAKQKKASGQEQRREQGRGR